MSLIRIALLVAAATASEFAGAQTALPSSLGQTKAIYDYCATLDPADAASFAAMWTAASGGLAGAKETPEFLATYNDTTAKLKALPVLTTKAGCQGGVAESKGKPWSIAAGGVFSNAPSGGKSDDDGPHKPEGSSRR